MRVDEVRIGDEAHVFVLEDSIFDSVLAVDGKDLIEAVDDAIACLDFHFPEAFQASVFVADRFSRAAGDHDCAGVAVVGDDFKDFRLPPRDGFDEDVILAWAEHGSG